MLNSSWPDWINSIAALIAAGAVVVGLFAKKTIDENRKTQPDLRKAEVAEELIAVSLRVVDAFKDIRRVLDSVPEDSISDPNYSYHKRLERISNYNELFEKLREAQVRVEAVIDDSEVDTAVSRLVEARADVYISIVELMDNPKEDRDPEEKEFFKDMRRKMRGTFSEKDELGQEILKAQKTIKKRLAKFAKLSG